MVLSFIHVQLYILAFAIESDDYFWPLNVFVFVFLIFVKKNCNLSSARYFHACFRRKIECFNNSLFLFFGMIHKWSGKAEKKQPIKNDSVFDRAIGCRMEKIEC